MRILLEEYVGYKVAINKVGTSIGAIRRAALQPEDIGPGDGEVLRSLIGSRCVDNVFFKNGCQRFAYLALEVWANGQGADIDKYSVGKEAAIRLAGSVGYSGRTGFYTPTRFAQPPYNLEYYRALNASEERNAPLFNEVDADLAVDCQRATSSACHCCTVPEITCPAWCPTLSASGPPLPLLKYPGYEPGVVEAIVQNNGFHVAIRFLDLSEAEYAAEVMRLMDKPLLFYNWKPSMPALKLRHNATRVFLPQDDCGSHSFSGSLGTWRCDFQLERLLKVTSANLVTRAPLAWQLLYSFRMTEGNSTELSDDWSKASLLQLLGALTDRQSRFPNQSLERHVDDVACRWVLNNRDVWEGWVRLEVPLWADASNSNMLVTSTLVTTLAFILLAYLWERYWLGTMLCGKKPSECCGRRKKSSPSTIRRRSSLIMSTWLQSRNQKASRLHRVQWEGGFGGASLKERLTRHESDALRRRTRTISTPSLATECTSSTDTPCACCVDFASPECEVSPRCGEASMRLCRTGDLSGRTAVLVLAHPGDAKSGVDYVFPEEGLECVFEPGASSAEVRVAICFHPTFGVAYAHQRKFYMELSCVTAGSAELKRPGALMHVQIAGEGRFPRDGLRTDAHPNQIMRSWLWVLYIDDRWQFWCAVLCRVYCVFHETVVLTLSLQLAVDRVVSYEEYYMLPVVIAPIVPSTFLCRWAERAFVTQSNAGPISGRLRALIFAKFWQLPMLAHLREEGKESQWLSALLRVEDITNSWLMVFDVIAQLAIFAFSIVVATLATTDWFEHPVSSSTAFTIMAVVGMAPACLAYICLTGRARHACVMLDTSDRMLHRLVDQMLWTQRSWPILTSQRPYMRKVEALHEHFQETNTKMTALLKRRILTDQTSNWLTDYVSSFINIILVYWGSSSVSASAHYGQGQLTVGGLFALTRIFGGIAKGMRMVFTDLLSFQHSAAVLNVLTELLNTGTSEDRLQRFLEAGNGESQEAQCPFCGTSEDETCICLHEVCFRYDPHCKDILFGVSVRIPLGCSLVIAGPSGAGKLTLLRLLSTSLKPSTGCLHVPRALRISLVDDRVCFIQGVSIMENLKLGMSDEVSEEDIQLLCEALSICSQRGPATKRSTSYALSGPKEHVGAREGFTTQLARALLRDPDILLADLRRVPQDGHGEVLNLMLCLWQQAGGLRNLLDNLRSLREKLGGGEDADSDCTASGFFTAALSSRVRSLANEEGPRTRTLAVLPASATALLESGAGPGFSLALCLSSRGACSIERATGLASLVAEGRLYSECPFSEASQNTRMDLQRPVGICTLGFTDMLPEDESDPEQPGDAAEVSECEEEEEEQQEFEFPDWVVTPI